MPILQDNIKLLESQRMQDTDDGGGHATGVVVADGQENAIFPDVSEADRVQGRVRFRKLFAAILTPDTDLYFGSNVIVAAVPSDPNINLTLFTTGSSADQRLAAQSRVESFVVRGPRLAGYLYDNHVQGQQAILILMRPEVTVPAVGDTLVVVKNPDDLDESEQYVQIQNVDSELRTFTSPTFGDYQRNVVTCEITDPLAFDVNGGQPSPFDDLGQVIDSRLHETLVADAARYFGTVGVLDPLLTGALSVNAATIFGQLVPSAQTEAAITNARPHSDLSGAVELFDGTRSFVTSVTFDNGAELHLHTGAYPGSLQITTGSGTITDKGGVLLLDALTIVGAIDYASGVLSFMTASSITGSKTVVWRPAVLPARNAQTAAFTVTAATRSQIVVFILDPRPAPGTLQVHYRAQGNWAVLRDNGSGALSGASAGLGAGTISYSTGDANITLGALPDVDTDIILVWSTEGQSYDRSGLSLKLAIAGALSSAGAEPGTVSFTWPDGGAGTFTAAADSAGVITGDATGTVNHRAGTYELRPNVLPPAGAQLDIDFQHGAPLSDTFNNPSPEPDTSLILSLGASNLLAGSVEVEWNVEPVYNSPAQESISNVGAQVVRAFDNGVGGLVDGAGDPLAGSVIDYVNGTVTFFPQTEVSVFSPTYTYQRLGTITIDGVTGTRWKKQALDTFQIFPVTGILPTDGSASVTVRYRGSDTPAAVQDQVMVNDLTVDLTPGFGEKIPAGAVLFDLGGSEHVDRGGRIDRDIDESSGAGTQFGTIDYLTGQVTATAWVPGDTNTVDVVGLVTTVGLVPVDEIAFRTPAAPVRPASLTVQFQYAGDSGLTTLQADANGDIVDARATGSIDHETGIVRLWFGQLVIAAGNESEPWYDPNAVDGAGMIWKPDLALADTIRFTAVSFVYLPLDADLLGLNPVRLPTDGRVPIFRPGDMAVVHHTDELAPATYNDTDVANAGRTRLERFKVIDNNGAVVDSSRYTVDLAAGTLTWDNTAGMAQPVTVRHTIADAALVLEAQITGEVTLSRQLTHDFPAGSLISSALQFGDLFARDTGIFEQETWTGVWSDVLIGNAPAASYDVINNPFTVTNEGAITERWALVFTNSASFDVIGETIGQIAVGNTGSTLAPINPATGVPYFSIPAAGWGAGWAAGNVLRFNTVGAHGPIWIVQTVQQGPEGNPPYTFEILIRGDVDA